MLSYCHVLRLCFASSHLILVIAPRLVPGDYLLSCVYIVRVPEHLDLYYHTLLTLISQ